MRRPKAPAKPRISRHAADAADTYRMVLDDLPLFMRWADDAGAWTFFNRSWGDFTGRGEEQERRDGWIAGVHGDDRDRIMTCVREAIDAREPFELVYRLRRHDGEYRWVMDFGTPLYDSRGAFTGYVSSAHDITERILEEQHLSHMATHDPLTDLPNRVLFNDRLRQALVEALRYEKLIAVLFVDLDHFKLINDTLGHDVGDQVLRAVSSRLLGCIRTGDTLARFGGDEFFLLLSEIANERDPAMVAQRILRTLAEGFAIGEHRCAVSASIGIALFPHHDSDAQTLTHDADMAMYRAKERGRNTFQFHPQALHDRVVRKLSLEGRLRKAIERKEFVLHFQPVVDALRGQPLAMEALIRWHHPELGVVSPEEFVPLAEETGLIVPLGEWALREACVRAKAWHYQGLSRVAVAVNLTRRHLREKNLCEAVHAVLEETDLDPRFLSLEIAESVLTEQSDVAMKTLRALHALGVRITMDHFGRGYASPSTLKEVPVECIKIDGTFVRDAVVSRDHAEIASVLIAMAAHLGITAIADGVESEAQIGFLLERGCRMMQGPYFGAPAPHEAIAVLLREGGAPEGRYPRQRTLPGME